MKKDRVIKVICILLVIFLLISTTPLGVFADNTLTTGSCGENVTYSFDDLTGILTISGSGTMDTYTFSSASPFKGNTEIQSVIFNLGVTSVGDYAFYGCTGLASVTISPSVISIGNFSFKDCSSLTSIDFSDSVETIGNYAFSKCAFSNITIPDSVTSMGAYAFSDCRSLQRIFIPNSVTAIGASAFMYCSNLTDITLPNCIKEIGVTFFWGCIRLKSITIPDSVTTIAAYAFQDCTALENIIIPESVISIGRDAFKGCNMLSTVKVLNNNCEIFDVDTTFPDCAEIFSHSNSTAKGYADKYSRTFTPICEDYYQIERLEPSFTKAGYEKHICTVCGYTEKEDLIYYKTGEDATRFADQQYVLPVAKSCVYNNTLYARFDKQIYGYNCFGSKFLYAEMLNKGIIENTRELVKGGPKGWYIVGGKLKSDGWYHIFQDTKIPDDLLTWSPNEPNGGGSETMLSITTADGGFNDIRYESTSPGFIVAIGLDQLQPTKESTFSTNKYAYYEMNYPFSYAQTFCEAKGGYLASISSKAENDSIMALISNKERVYFGGIRNSQGNFEWVNGEDFSYTNWYPGEPNNGAGKGQYFMQSFTDGQWDDCNDLYAENKSNQVGFVCEYEPLKIYAKLAQDNVHGITDEEVKIIAEYPDKTTADITSSCDIDYHYNKGNVVVHATATKPNGEEIEVTNSLAVNKGNHRFEEGDATQATCTQAGQSTVVCSICGKVITTSIPAKGHQLTKDIVEPTCEKSGYQREFCSACDYDEKFWHR